MANHTRSLDSATPPDTEKAAFVGRRHRENDVDVAERMNVNHSWGGSQTETDNNFDGRHTIVDLKEEAAAPARGIANMGSLYTKNDGAFTELFFENENGDEAQITKVGFLPNKIQYGFSAIETAAQAIPNLTAVTLTFGTVEFNAGTVFANPTFTAPVTGVYHFVISLSTSEVAATNAYLYCRFFKNGVHYRVALYNRIAGYCNEGLWGTASLICLLTAGDTITISIGHNTGVVINAFSRSFHGYLLGVL